jgi:hypothetical protein
MTSVEAGGDWNNIDAERLEARESSPRHARSAPYQTVSARRRFLYEHITCFLLAPELKPSQTFEIILPNLIHKSKKRNLH